MQLEQHSGIYSIRNKLNDKQYIGSAKNIRARWKEHVKQLRANRHHSPIFQHAWNKYGAEAFEFSVRLVCTLDMLISYEQNFLDVFQPAYNCAVTAGSNLGYKHSKQAKANMSAAAKAAFERRGYGVRKGQSNTDEHNAKVAAANLGTKKGPYPEERVAKVAAALKGRKRAPKTIEKMRAAAKGKVPSAQARARISAANTGRKFSPEFGAQISARQLGKSMPEGHSENVGRAKASLTDDQVRQIRADRAAGRSLEDMAKEYGINSGSLSVISRGLSYKWVK